MEQLIKAWQWLVENKEWLFSGIGVPIAGWLLFRLYKKPSAVQDSIPPSNTFTNTFTCNNGEQNVAQGDHAIGQQNNHNGNRATNSGTGGVVQNGGTAAGEGGVAVGRDVGGDVIINNYPRTPQGIPLQRPKQADHLVGREKLLKEVLAALQPGKVVTLCGPGGMGKTALASRIAWELSPKGKPPTLFPDGLLFSSFYGRKDVSLAFEHLVRSYSDDAQDNSREAVCRLLANKQALIILDGAEEADDLPAVLRCCGGCGVLITSRKRSDAPGSLFEVKVLDKLPAAQAFRLYSNTDADEATVQAICQQLGGWPLALRLAGHYLRNTGESATEYLRWLEKESFKELGDGKQQDENAALLLRRSVAQVSDDARFALGVAGTLAFTPIARESVAAILGDLGDDERRVRMALNELVNYGLLEKREERWQISHALIHTYARTELALNKEVLERLAWYSIKFYVILSKTGSEGYARLDKERAHCLRLMESCLDCGLWQYVKAFVGAVWNYLDRQGYWTEQWVAVEMSLIAARQDGDRRNEAQCLNNFGYICERRGKHDKALMWFEKSLPIWRELGEDEGEAATQNNIGDIYRQQGRYELALEIYQYSLTIKRKIGDRADEVITLNNIGMVYDNQGYDTTALEKYEQCLPIWQEAGDKRGESTCLNNIAMIYRAQGNMVKALESLEKALAIRRKLGDRTGEAESHWNIGLIYDDLGDFAKAEEYIALAVEIAEAMGHPRLDQFRDGLEQVRAKRQGA